ncbi:hypothetical protein [Dactylosporangium sp. NPDC048998]|uniref:hypothetical protein n=1 Tax=Dactylosporangium sp. NPDC048998 TaxID=3363976 RepID=UPI0037149AAE
MRAWIATIAAVGVLAGLTACGKDGPADQQDACSIALNDATRTGGRLDADISKARMTGGTDHYQAMVDARSEASDWHASIVAQVNRDISPELKQTLNDGAKMVGEVLATLDDATSTPPDARSKIEYYQDKVRQACRGAFS